jgi:hypothetical protein
MKKFYISKDSKQIFSNEYRLVNGQEVRNSIGREIEETTLNHDIEELKMSIRIAKINLAIDPKNKYYQDKLGLIENELKNILN